MASAASGCAIWKENCLYRTRGSKFTTWEEALEKDVIEEKTVSARDLLQEISWKLGADVEDLKAAAVQILNQQSEIEEGDLEAAAA